MSTNPFGSTGDVFKSPFASRTPAAPTQNYAEMAKAIGDSAQASATTGTFDESKGTAGRVQQLTDQGGSLMAAARTRAAQRSVRSGLQNTSTAAQAGEQAVIETATPIASADAQLYQQQQLANQNALNSVAIANANIRAQTGMAGLSLGENARQFDTGLSWDKDKTGMTLMEQRRQFDQTMGLEGKKLDQNQSQFNQTLGLEGRKLDVSQSQFSQTLGLEGQKLAQQDSQFGQNLQLQRDNLAAQREQFAQSLGLDVAKLNLSRDQMTQQQQQFLAQLNQRDQELAQQQSQFTSNLGQQAEQFRANLDLQRQNLDAQREQFAQKLGLDKDQLQLNRDQLGQQDRQFLAELDQRAAQLQQQESQFVRDQQNKVTLANLDASNRERLMQLEAGYKTEIAGNENISRAWGTMMDSINQIQNNPDLDQAAKQTMISNTQASFQSFAAFWKKASGGTADVSDLLNFGPVGGSAGGSGGSGGQSSGGGRGTGQYDIPPEDWGIKPGDRGG